MTEMLDASALLALVQSEPGADVVAEAIEDAVISAVNFSEVVSKLADKGYPRETIEEELRGSHLAIIDFDASQAFAAGMLRPLTRSAGLSLGDRACIALGTQLGCGVLTSDREWATLDLGVEVRLFR